MFEAWLAGRPLADRSRREYARNVRAYCAWLAATPDREGWQGDPLGDALARDHAARDFRRYLRVEPPTTSWSTTSTSCRSPRTGAPAPSQAPTGNAPPLADAPPPAIRWRASSGTSAAP